MHRAPAPAPRTWLPDPRVCIGNRRIAVRPERRVQRHPAADRAAFLAHPSLNQLDGAVATEADLDLPRTGSPTAISSMTALAPEAEVETVARQRHPRELRIPLEAPVVAMIVPAEHRLQSFELEEGLHERHVLIGIGVHGLGAALAGCDSLQEVRSVNPDYSSFPFCFGFNVPAGSVDCRR